MLASERYLDALRSDGDAFAAAAGVNLTARVPSCPDWDVAALVRHLGRIHRHKASIVRAGVAEFRPEFRTSADVAAPDDPALLEWYREGLDILVDALAGRDADAPAWSWAGDHRVAFWQRRMAQETAVHRWDAENANGGAAPIAPDLAADGIDELLGLFVRVADAPYEGAGARVALLCSDTGDAWTVTLERGVVARHTRGLDAADATVSAAASDLLLFVWRRVGVDAVDVTGRRELAEGLWAYLEGATQ